MFSAGQKWLQTLDLLTQQAADVDEYLLERFRQRWAALQNKQLDVLVILDFHNSDVF